MGGNSSHVTDDRESVVTASVSVPDARSRHGSRQCNRRGRLCYHAVCFLSTTVDHRHHQYVINRIELNLFAVIL